MDLKFDFKKTKEEVLEKYPNFPVMTFLGGNKTSKFKLNRMACELLNFDNKGHKISFALGDEDKLVLVNTTTVATNNQSNLTANNDFSNAKFLDRFQKHFDVEINVNDEFILVQPVTKAEYPVLILSKDSPESMTTDDFEEFPDNAFAETETTEKQLDTSYDEPSVSQEEKDFYSQE